MSLSRLEPLDIDVGYAVQPSCWEMDRKQALVLVTVHHGSSIGDVEVVGPLECISTMGPLTLSEPHTSYFLLTCLIIMNELEDSHSLHVVWEPMIWRVCEFRIHFDILLLWRFKRHTDNSFLLRK